MGLMQKIGQQVDSSRNPFAIQNFGKDLAGYKAMAKVKSKVKEAMVRALPLLKRDAKVWLTTIIQPQRELSRLLGQDRSAIIERVCDGKGKTTATSATIKNPRRKKDIYFFYGVGDLIRSPRHTFALRHKAVKAGLFSEKILHISPFGPPFSCRNKGFFEQRKGVSRKWPLIPISEKTEDDAAGDICDMVLAAWGFYSK